MHGRYEKSVNVQNVQSTLQWQNCIEQYDCVILESVMCYYSITATFHLYIIN